MNEKKPKVSVCVITYNQEKYIHQCLQSIVDQNTNFYFEVIVGDDCSTDSTRTIVQEFVKKYPDVVRPIFHEKNIGGTNNLLAVHSAANGGYIAHVDGDDYMLPGKLKTQADELDNNPDCTICVHEMKRFDQNNERFLYFVPKIIPRKADITFLLMNLTYFAHSSKMYRAECRNGLKILSEEILDCYFHVHHALSGNILYLNEHLGVYRVNIGFATDFNDNRNTIYRNPSPKLIDLALEAIEYARRSGIAPIVINKSIAKLYFDYSYSCLLAKNFNDFKVNIKKSIDTVKLNSLQVIFYYFSYIPMLLFIIIRFRSEVRTKLCFYEKMYQEYLDGRRIKRTL